MKIGFSSEGPYQEPSWQAQLDALCPPDGHLGWLHLYWEAGFPWEHVGRWMIGQVVPAASVDDAIKELLEGPNPANFGQMVDGQWETFLPGISRRQWHFYRESGGCLLLPYWVVQGSRGGHKLRLTHAESRIVELQGGDPNPPAPGDLPYARPDRRTFNMLAKMDMVRKHNLMVGYLESRDERLDRKEQDALVLMREMLWNDWLEPMCGEWGDRIGWHLDKMGNDGPKDLTLDQKVEEAKHSFIHEGA